MRKLRLGKLRSLLCPVAESGAMAMPWLWRSRSSRLTKVTGIQMLTRTRDRQELKKIKVTTYLF